MYVHNNYKIPNHMVNSQKTAQSIHFGLKRCKHDVTGKVGFYKAATQFYSRQILLHYTHAQYMQPYTACTKTALKTRIQIRYRYQLPNGPTWAPKLGETVSWQMHCVQFAFYTRRYWESNRPQPLHPSATPLNSWPSWLIMPAHKDISHMILQHLLNSHMWIPLIAAFSEWHFAKFFQF